MGVVGAVAVAAIVIFHFLFNPFTIQDLEIAVITALGLVLPCRRFFSASAEQPSHVR